MIQRLFTQGTKIVCVGRNYAAHAKELGNAVPKVSSPSLSRSLARSQSLRTSSLCNPIATQITIFVDERCMRLRTLNWKPLMETGTSYILKADVIILGERRND